MMPLKTLFLFPLRSLSIPLGATDLGGESPFFILIPSFLLPLPTSYLQRKRKIQISSSSFSSFHPSLDLIRTAPTTTVQHYT